MPVEQIDGNAATILGQQGKARHRNQPVRHLVAGVKHLSDIVVEDSCVDFGLMTERLELFEHVSKRLVRDPLAQLSKGRITLAGAILVRVRHEQLQVAFDELEQQHIPPEPLNHGR
jgi:hypothetical protein